MRWVDGVGPGRLGGRLAGGTRPGGGGRGSPRRCPGVRQSGAGSSLTEGDGHSTADHRPGSTCRHGRGVTLYSESHPS